MVSPHSVISVVGPTASGKSSFAMALARRFNGEIVNADSRQFYRELNIGTAKPSKEDQAEVKHHLIDCSSIAKPWDVADFVRTAHLAIDDVVLRGRVPIVVGGTGLYMRCLLFGLAEIPSVPEALKTELRERLETKGLDVLYSTLKKLDPVGAERLRPTDTQRILRALEVVMHTGRAIHEYWQSRTEPVLKNLMLGLNPERKALYRAIDARVLDMAKQGLREEAAALFATHPNNPVLNKTIGYAEWPRHGFDPVSEARVVADIQTNSRRFAKRQITWFRHEGHLRWLVNPVDCQEVDNTIAAFLTRQ